MKVKLLFLVLIIATLFSFVLHKHDTKIVDKKEPATLDNLNDEKELMQPYAMTDRNQFD